MEPDTTPKVGGKCPKKGHGKKGKRANAETHNRAASWLAGLGF
jgi:hypothetical protein